MFFLCLEYWASQFLYLVRESGTMSLYDSVDNWAVWLWSIELAASTLNTLWSPHVYLSPSTRLLQSHMGLQLLLTDHRLVLTLALLNLLCSNYKYLFSLIAHKNGNSTCMPNKDNYFLLMRDLNPDLWVQNRLCYLLSLLSWTNVEIILKIKLQNKFSQLNWLECFLIQHK